MSHRFLISTGILGAAIAVVSLSAVAGQAPKSGAPAKAGEKATAAPKAVKAAPAARTCAPPKPPCGDPDLQGVWNDATSTPLQRPNALSGDDMLTDEEAAHFRAETARTVSHDRRDGRR